MRRAPAALAALLLAAGLAGPASAHGHAATGETARAALDAGSGATPRPPEACVLCSVRAPVRHLLGAAPDRAGLSLRPSDPLPPAPLLRAAPSPLRGAAPTRAPPQRA